MIDRNKELNNCVFVKSVLMILVVVGHSLCFWGGEWFTKNPVNIVIPLINIADWLNSFHTYGFVLISGYLFYYLKYERVNREDYQHFTTFLITKIKRLLIPYICIASIWVIPISFLFLNYELKDIVDKFILGIAPGQLWFLLMLFGVFVLFYPFSNFLRIHNVFGILMVFALYFLGILGAVKLTNIFQIFRACTYFPFFYIGFKIRQYGSTVFKKIPIILYIIFDILLFILSLKISHSDEMIFKLLNFFFELILHITGALMSFVVLQKIANKINPRNSKLFDFLGKNSMSIYLFHQQVIYVIIYLLNGIINPYLHSIVNFVGSMIVSLLISMLIKKIKWTRFIIGEK